MTDLRGRPAGPRVDESSEERWADAAGVPRSMECLEEHDAIALLEGVDDGGLTRSRAHLRECERCQEYVAALAQVLMPPSEASVGGWGLADGVLSPGTRLDQYVVEAMIGRGGMGAVYRAHDERLNRAVAIKVLQEELGERRVGWLRREAGVMAALSHPNIAEVFDFGGADAGPFVVMELIRGTTLAEWARTELSPEERLRAYVQAGQGLLAAHRAGVVHRDFKPSNAMMTTEGDVGRVKVLDFGLAGAYGGGLVSAGALMGSSTHSGLGGTPRYAAPEQFLGDPATPASDQFSFCVALFEALTGLLPFPGLSGSARRTAMLRGELRSMPPSVPISVTDALERGLSLQPGARFDSMRTLLSALEGSRSRRPALVAGVGLFIAAGWAIAPQEETPCADGVERMERAWPRTRAAQWAQRPELLRQAARLDSYVEDWLAARGELCETRTDDVVRFESGASCLERLAARVGEAGGRLRKLAAQGGSLPSNLLGSLGRPDGCLDASFDEQQDELLRDEVDVFRSRAASIRDEGTSRLEDSPELLTRGRGLLKRARELGDVRSEAAVINVLAAAALERDKHDKAERLLEEAYFLAKLAGDEASELDATENLVLLLAQYVIEPQRAAYWAAEAARIAAGRSDVDRGRAELLLAWVEQASGQPEKALEHYSKAVPHLREDRRHWDALEGEARANLNLQRWEEARAGLEAAIDEQERELGPTHSSLAKPLNTLASLEIMAKNFDKAAKLLERAISVTPDGDAIPRAMTKGNLAILLKRIGELDRSLAIFEEIRGDFERMLGGQHESTIRTELAIIEVLTLLERSDEALRRVERALKNGVPDWALSVALFSRASLVEDPRPDLARILTLPGEPESTYRAAREGLASLESAP
ncbi:MAG: protein kinase domain-containing protein [Nannocystales bacterium]